MNTPSEHNLDYLVSDNSITKLKERHSYYFQVQGQMGITEIKQAIFFIYTHHGYFIQFIEFDSDLWKQMIFKFNYFCSKYIAPEILNSNRVHNSTLCSKDINTQPFVSLLSENNKKDTSSESVCGFCFNVKTKQPKSQCDYSILCELCNQWYHISCAGVTEEQFNNKNFSWTCSFCPPIDFTINFGENRCSKIL